MTLPAAARPPAPGTSVLVVDDDDGLRRALRITLRGHGYRVRVAADAGTALEAFAADPPDLVILDLGLPDLDGKQVLTRMRRRSAVPILVLSARHESAEKVASLDLGADDYVAKPFGMPELLARVRVALRHAAPLAAPVDRVVRTPHLTLDLGRRTAVRDDQPVHLSPTEWRLVEELVAEPGELIRHEDLLQRVWGPKYGRETNYLRVYLAQLRRKLEPDPRRPRHFLTEPGVGHRFVP